MQPETKPRRAPTFRPMTSVIEDDEQSDYDVDVNPIVVNVDYDISETVEQVQTTRDADTGEVHTRVVPAVVSNGGFDSTALDNYADWIRIDPESRQPDQWAAYAESDV